MQSQQVRPKEGLAHRQLHCCSGTRTAWSLTGEVKLHLRLEGSQGWRSCTRLPAIPRESGPNSSRTQLFLADKASTASQPRQVGQPHTRTKPQLLQSPPAAHSPGKPAGMGSRCHPPPPATRGAPGKGKNSQHQRTAFKTEASLGCRSVLTTATAIPGTEGWMDREHLGRSRTRVSAHPFRGAPAGSDPGFWWEQGRVISSSHYTDGQANKNNPTNLNTLYLFVTDSKESSESMSSPSHDK